MEILTNQHNRWPEFIERLTGEEGCNFRKGKNGFTWDCNSTPDRPLARKILEQMGGIDIEATLKYFDNNGGHCDCEIVWNVDFK